MKKVVLSCALVAVVGLFASCSKNCTCTSYVNGEEVGTVEISKTKLKDGQKCSDLSTVVVIGGKKNGTECRG